jgi:formylglycine-generating enzyme required for sulfatase activity/tRNA A-37 threonylcarbamoyl transferase component Bud32
VIEQKTLAATLGDRYRLERQLGAGGMATVFLARDLKHDRHVAIKVLKPELAQSLTAERFLREIAITARLNHPHILPLLDSGTADDGAVLYYVMPVATGESLRDHLAHHGAMSVAESVRCATEVTEALVAAHALGVVHRDIKPDNVLLSGGHAVVVDFGIAKAVGDARDTNTLTMDGVSLGTPAYMAPEQAAGIADVDHRADIYAVGAMLWEMCAGRAPFEGSLQQILTSKLTKPAPSLADACPAAPPALVKLVARCLAIEPEQRPQSGSELLAALRDIGAPRHETSSRRTQYAAAAVVMLVVAGAALFYMRDQRARWVHEVAVPNIQRLIEADQLDSAFALETEAVQRAPNDSSLGKFWFPIAQEQSFITEPPGATVTRAALNDTTHWIPVGTTPTGALRVPRNAWLYRYAKDGYRTVTIMGARLGGSYVPIPDPVPLRKLTDPDTDMVLIAGAKLSGTIFGLDAAQRYDLPNFLIDRLEVTNRQYKTFVDAGGYTKPELWDTIVRDGRTMRLPQARTLFVDKSGRPGPSSWVGGAPPQGEEELPVGGVSWYEARAYARFVNKDLPTVVEWNAAAMPEAARWVVPHGRFETTTPVRGGNPAAVGPRGVYDMAGNVREWIVNASEPGSRYILGGGWSDPIYLFSELYAQPELDRSAINGIRLIKRTGTTPDLARAEAPIPRPERNTKTLRPVDDAVFKSYLALYDYDHTPLNAKVESRDSSEADWIREDILVDEVGVGGRLPVVVFVPRHAKPPYQTAVIWPASDALIMPSVKELPMWMVDYIVRSGRIVIYPVYEGTLGRKLLNNDAGFVARRDREIRRAKDMRRAIDYAVSRADVDSTRIAYAGASWGGRLGGLAVAIEPRFKAAILYVAGLGADPVRPEIDPVNFLPHIRIPVLMLSGKYDSVFPVESSQLPFFNLLGSPAADKKRIVYEGGHFLPRPQMVSESLNWLDRYLGPVSR